MATVSFNNVEKSYGVTKVLQPWLASDTVLCTEGSGMLAKVAEPVRNFVCEA